MRVTFKHFLAGVRSLDECCTFFHADSVASLRLMILAGAVPPPDIVGPPMLFYTSTLKAWEAHCARPKPKPREQRWPIRITDFFNDGD